VSVQGGDFLKASMATWSLKTPSLSVSLSRTDSRSSVNRGRRDSTSSDARKKSPNKKPKITPEEAAMEAEDNALHKIVTSLPRPVVHPFIFRCAAVEVAVLEGSQSAIVDVGRANQRQPRRLFRQPLSFSGVFAPSSLPSHPKYTDLRVDLLCSPLSVAVSPQVDR
jgi:hypothetical protein